jgi:hypothetical protein
MIYFALFNPDSFLHISYLWYPITIIDGNNTIINENVSYYFKYMYIDINVNVWARIENGLNG